MTTSHKNQSQTGTGQDTSESVLAFVGEECERMLGKNSPTVGGRNPAPLGNHGKPWFVVFTRESSLQGFLGGAGFRPSTVCFQGAGFLLSRGLTSGWHFLSCLFGVPMLLSPSACGVTSGEHVGSKDSTALWLHRVK